MLVGLGAWVRRWGVLLGGGRGASSSHVTMGGGRRGGGHLLVCVGPPRPPSHPHTPPTNKPTKKTHPTPGATLTAHATTPTHLHPPINKQTDRQTNKHRPPPPPPPGATLTAQGITTKSLLLGFAPGQLLALDRRLLDPRRPVLAPGKQPTAAERAEGGFVGGVVVDGWRDFGGGMFVGEWCCGWVDGWLAGGWWWGGGYECEAAAAP